MTKYYPPVFNETEFHCAHCKVYAKQEWKRIYIDGYLDSEMRATSCVHCRERSYWYKEKLIIPDVTMASPPHKDMPEDVKNDYSEAASILNKSPRGSAALLRLCVQKLMVQLGEKGKNINADIKSLVQKGLPVEVQQSLDILRVIGNESVHPGTMNMDDDKEIAIKLFELINFIVEDRITRPKSISELYESLPESKRKHIEGRDKQ